MKKLLINFMLWRHIYLSKCCLRFDSTIKSLKQKSLPNILLHIENISSPDAYLTMRKTEMTLHFHCITGAEQFLLIICCSEVDY